jgi:2-polyprenyl-3-methyl-5-hydroxy-6-metoxy-1,4-benzoquinol methylase
VVFGTINGKRKLFNPSISLVKFGGLAHTRLMVEDNNINSAGQAACPVCQSCQTATFQDVREYRFRKCEQCQFVFLHPMPSEMVLESMYNMGGKITPYFYPKAKSRLHRALRIAMHLYRFAWRGPVLDVGCGGGFQVEAFRRLGMRPTGLDISVNSIAFARNKFKKSDFYCECFEKFSSRGKKFQLIYSSELIEHVTDIDLYMKFLLHNTADRGYVYITTPDISSPLVPGNILDWDVFNPPRHVQFFQPKNLRRLFEDRGFSVSKRFRGPKSGLRYLFRKN